MTDTKHIYRPMRLVTAVELAATAGARFREHYKHWSDDDKFADGDTKGDVIAALNSQQHTPENITRIINASWAYPECDCCNQRKAAVVEIAQPYSSERQSRLCLSCIQTAATILGVIPSATDEVPA